MALTTTGGAASAASPNTSRPRAKSALATRQGRIGLAYAAPWIIGFILWYLVPMVASLWFSFTDFDLVSGEPPQFTGLDNWAKLFADPELRASALVTLRFGAISLPFAIGVPIGLAYLLVSRNLRFKATFRLLFFMPSVIPFVAATLLFGGILNGQTGWVNRMLALVGISGPNWFQDETWVYPALMFIGLWGVGNAMIIFIASMSSVPASLYDAATIDGAGQFALFRHVTLPMISPVIFYNVVIALIGLFNYFLAPFVLTNGSGEPNGRTLFYPMYFFRVGFRLFDMGYAAAIAWALFVVAILITGALFWSARYWVHYEFEK